MIKKYNTLIRFCILLLLPLVVMTGSRTTILMALYRVKLPFIMEINIDKDKIITLNGQNLLKAVIGVICFASIFMFWLYRTRNQYLISKRRSFAREQWKQAIILKKIRETLMKDVIEYLISDTEKAEGKLSGQNKDIRCVPDSECYSSSSGLTTIYECSNEHEYEQLSTEINTSFENQESISKTDLGKFIYKNIEDNLRNLNDSQENKTVDQQSAYNENKNANKAIKIKNNSNRDSIHNLPVTENTTTVANKNKNEVEEFYSYIVNEVEYQEIVVGMGKEEIEMLSGSSYVELAESITPKVTNV